MTQSSLYCPVCVTNEPERGAGEMADTYTHVTAQMQQAAADKIGGFMESTLPGESAPEPTPSKGKIIPFERVG